MKGTELLRSAPVGRAVWKLAIPAILGTLISLIYNLTDTYFIGLTRDTYQLTAISLTMPYMWMASALGGFICAGAPQVISLLLGAGDKSGAEKCKSFSFFGTLAVSALLTPIMYILIRPVMTLLGAEGPALDYTCDYLRIIIAATPIICAGSALQGILRADGRTSIATRGSALGIIINIIFDPIFILALKMGMTGAALATALGAAASLIYCLIYVKGEIHIKSAVPGREMAKKVCSLSLASACPSIISAITVGASLGMASTFGGETVASISVASKLYSVAVSIAQAAAFSLQPFVGYNYAAKNTARVRRGIKIEVIWGTAFCVMCAAAFVIFGERFMTLFTSDAGIIASGTTMLKMLAVGTPVAAAQMTCLMYLSATGRAARSLIVGLSRQVIIFIPMLLILRSIFGINGMMLAYPVTDVISTILAAILCFSERSSPVHNQFSAEC